MCLKQKQRIIYSICSILVAVLVVLFFPNIDTIKRLGSNVPAYDSGTVKPYLEDGDLYRFAIDGINREITYMEIHVLGIGNEDFEVKVHYQGFETEEYFEIDTKTAFRNGNVEIIPLKNAPKARNFYVDISGKFQITPSIVVMVSPITFKIKWDTVVLGICILLLAQTVYAKKDFLLDIYHNKDILKMLLANDITARYAGTFLGGAWSYAQPVISIFVFWFVFQLGFKSSPVQNIPFILWFLPAYISWMYFQDVISYSASCLREYSYLVKKIKFKVNIIPVIKVLAAFKIHICFLVVTFIIYAVYGVMPSVKCVQLIYYAVAMVFLLSGISWFIAALNVFVKDLAPIINIILQLGYFAIPIFWNEDMLHPFVVKILKYNPAYYVVQGYRESICGGNWFWEDVGYMSYYWSIAIIVFCMSLWLFDEAKKHFSDLL